MRFPLSVAYLAVLWRALVLYTLIMRLKRSAFPLVCLCAQVRDSAGPFAKMMIASFMHLFIERGHPPQVTCVSAHRQCSQQTSSLWGAFWAKLLIICDNKAPHPVSCDYKNCHAVYVYALIVQFPVFSCAGVALPAKDEAVVILRKLPIRYSLWVKKHSFVNSFVFLPTPSPPSSSEVFSPSLFSCQISELCLACKYWTRSKGSHLAFSFFLCG